MNVTLGVGKFRKGPLGIAIWGLMADILGLLRRMGSNLVLASAGKPWQVQGNRTYRSHRTYKSQLQFTHTPGARTHFVTVSPLFSTTSFTKMKKGRLPSKTPRWT